MRSSELALPDDHGRRLRTTLRLPASGSRVAVRRPLLRPPTIQCAAEALQGRAHDVQSLRDGPRVVRNRSRMEPMSMAGLFLLVLVAVAGGCFGGALFARALLAISKWHQERRLRSAIALTVAQGAVTVFGAAVM